MNEELFLEYHGLTKKKLLAKVSSKEVVRANIFDAEIYKTEVPFADILASGLIVKYQNVQHEVSLLRKFENPKDFESVFPVPNGTPTVSYAGSKFVRLTDLPMKNKYNMIRKLPCVHILGSVYVAVDRFANKPNSIAMKDQIVLYTQR